MGRDRSKQERIILWEEKILGRERKQKGWNNPLEEKYNGKRKKAGIIVLKKKIFRRDRKQKG